MNLYNHLSITLVLVAWIFVSCQSQNNRANSTKSVQLVGTYTDGYTMFLNIKNEYGKLFVEEAFTRGLYSMEFSDSSQVLLNGVGMDIEIPCTVDTNDSGDIIGLEIAGKYLAKKSGDNSSPIELLLSGSVDAGVREYLANNDKYELEELGQIGNEILRGIPSKHHVAVGLFQIITEEQPTNGEANYQLGQALLRIGKRDLAIAAFRNALSHGIENRTAIEDLLDVLENGMQCKTYPQLDFDSLFAQPSAEELQAVEKDWVEFRTNLSKTIKHIGVVLDTPYTNGAFNGRLKVLSYIRDDSLYYGGIFVPATAKSKMPVIVEAKGVNWQYSGHRLAYRPKLSGCLGQNANDFIFIVPGYIGETMQFGDYVFRNAGLPNDAYAGATDSYLAFFEVAMNYLNNRIDTNHVISFGDSRGGTVALLAAIRDPRFTATVEWTGPTNWLSLMGGRNGLTLKEQLIHGLDEKTRPESGTPGQFIDWYFHNEANTEFAHIRHQLIASSPLFFANKLPQQMQLHYGIEDLSVPVENGYRLFTELQEQRGTNNEVQAFFHENAGHDLNHYEALIETKAFILNVTGIEEK